jgi:hypothetical protein
MVPKLALNHGIFSESSDTVMVSTYFLAKLGVIIIKRREP